MNTGNGERPQSLREIELEVEAEVREWTRQRLQLGSRVGLTASPHNGNVSKQRSLCRRRNFPINLD